MHKDILPENQRRLLPLIGKFSGDFVLVGGTAIAFFIGHRESIDFDLFSCKRFDNLSIINRIKEGYDIESVIIDKADELTVVVDGVKVTFLYYPYAIREEESFDGAIGTPSLLTLSAMKAYALGRRAKWKDYVDLYFILQSHHSTEEIIKKAEELFKNEFNEKNFRVQLSYFDDIDYTEEINYKSGFEAEKEEIQIYLQQIAQLSVRSPD